MRRLEGRRILVTGASSGIGRAVAQRCASEGARVLASGRSAAELARTADGFEGIVTFACDLTDEGSAEACVGACVAKLGGIDGLMHAAGIVRRGEDVRDTGDAELAAFLDVNLSAAFRIAREAIRALRAAADPGSLVLTTSQLAHVGAPGYASYCAAKGGVSALVRALAIDVGPHGIRVNALAPGLTRTPMAYVDRDDFDGSAPALAALHPLRRIGEAEDMAGPSTFLLSDDSAWMTGQTLTVDGGYTAQ
jgi:L-xylulose reductase